MTYPLPYEATQISDRTPLSTLFQSCTWLSKLIWIGWFCSIFNLTWKSWRPQKSLWSTDVLFFEREGVALSWRGLCTQTHTTTHTPDLSAPPLLGIKMMLTTLLIIKHFSHQASAPDMPLITRALSSLPAIDRYNYDSARLCFCFRPTFCSHPLTFSFCLLLSSSSSSSFVSFPSASLFLSPHSSPLHGR